MLLNAKRLIALLVLFMGSIPVMLRGQASFEAQVRGVVRDSSGSVIVGAR